MEQSKMSLQGARLMLFGKQQTTLDEIDIDISGIIETCNYFLKAQQEDSDLKIPVYRAKFPSGGGKSFEILTGDEALDMPISSFRGVIVKHSSCNVMYLEDEGNEEITPFCQSHDGIEGICRDNGEIKNCSDCQYNQWGSGKNGGKLCRNKKMLLIFAEGCNVPLVMYVPPTSVREWEKYKSNVLGLQRKTPQDVVTEFSLSLTTSKSNIKYSIAKFKAVGLVPVNTRSEVLALADGKYTNAIEDASNNDQ